MNNNSKAIVILCSHLCLGDNINPLTFKEWEEMAERLLFFNMQPEDILAPKIGRASCRERV